VVKGDSKEQTMKLAGLIFKALGLLLNERGATSIDPMSLSTTATQYLLSTYYDKRMLERLVPKPVMWDFGQKKSLPKGEGKTVKWSRLTNLGNTMLLSEGTRPTPLSISSLNVTAQLKQLGDYVAVSDYVDMTAISSLVEGAVDLFATQAGTSIDLFARDQLFGGNLGYGVTAAISNNRNISAWVRSGATGSGSTSALSALRGKTIGFYVDFVNQLSAGVTKNFSGFGATLNVSAWNKYPLTVNDIRDAVLRLQEANVPPMEDGYYVGFIHPTAAAGLKKDSQWQNWNQYSGELTKQTMYKGELGEVERVRFVASTLVMKRAMNKGSNISGCFTTIIGKDAYGTIDFDGGVHVYVKQPNQYDTSNPLNQWTTIGWKITLAARILEAERGVHMLSIN
jgi:N4-gp56 family major capsid protein